MKEVQPDIAPDAGSEMNSSDPHTAASVQAPIHPTVDVIYEAARAGKLVMCAGAGLSIAGPAALPSGGALGEDLDGRLSSLIAGYESPSNPSDLIAVADAGSALEGGESAIRGEVLKLADFKGAEPNFGHRATAELLCEGCISLLLLWNWDTCIERVDTSPEVLQVSRSSSDLKDLTEPSIAKVHGCATRRESLLVTSSDLARPPVWADNATREHLRGKTVVFVGVGDIADYAKRRLKQLQEELEESEGGEADLDIWVVSPGIKQNWDNSAWAELLPNLPDERRVEMTADEFLDQLARRWVREALDGIKAATSGASAGTKKAIEELSEKLDAKGSIKVLRWTRASGLGQRVGISLILTSALKQLLIGYAVLARDTEVTTLAVRAPGAIELDGKRVEALISCDNTPAQKVRVRARERARDLAEQGLVDDEAAFMVAGSVIGPLDAEHDLDLAAGEQTPDHLVAGPTAVRLSYYRASELEAAA